MTIWSSRLDLSRTLGLALEFAAVGAATALAAAGARAHASAGGPRLIRVSGCFADAGGAATRAAGAGPRLPYGVAAWGAVSRAGREHAGQRSTQSPTPFPQ